MNLMALIRIPFRDGRRSDEPSIFASRYSVPGDNLKQPGAKRAPGMWGHTHTYRMISRPTS
jgi:hypothetical protein